MKITEYINKHFSGNKASFARHMSTIPQRVTRWVNEEWIVIENRLYSPRKEIPPVEVDNEKDR